MKTMPIEAFSHHTGSGKNDFAAWVYDVVGDKKLAQALKKLKTQKGMAKKVESRIAELSKNNK